MYSLEGEARLSWSNDNSTVSIKDEAAPFQEGPAQEGPAHEGPVHEGPAQEGPAHKGNQLVQQQDAATIR